MSLKAKIEAVIYASEEPVTLGQLVGLLGLEAQGELDRLAERQGELGLVSAEETATATGAIPQVLRADGPDDAGPEAAGPEAEGPEAEEPDAGEPIAPPAAEASAPAEPSAAEKRQGRERERRLREFFQELLDELVRDYLNGDRGLEVREVAGGYRMATRPEYHDAVRGFVRSLKPPLKLTLPALETLAVVAYKQPVTVPEVSEIRGVDSGGVLGSLLGRKLVATAGRKQVIGRPILYRTTKDFLLRFGLKDISELPSIEEFEKLASQLVEQEEMVMTDGTGADSAAARITHENLEEERNAVEPQADGDSDSLGADDGSELPADALPAVDGRASSPPPRYDQSDPSARDAAIQEEEQA